FTNYPTSKTLVSSISSSSFWSGNSKGISIQLSSNSTSKNVELAWAGGLRSQRGSTGKILLENSESNYGVSDTVVIACFASSGSIELDSIYVNGKNIRSKPIKIGDKDSKREAYLTIQQSGFKNCKEW